MRLPYSLLFFLVAALVFLLQWLPFTGFFLMLLMAPLWSVLLVNAGFAGTAVEAAIKRVPLVWLALPLAWFGGYTAFALAEQRAFRRLQDEVAASNAAIRIAFDAERHSLVIAEGREGEWFVINTELPVIYARNPNFAGARHLATRMVAREACARIGPNAAARAAGVHAFGFHDGSVQEKRFCTVRQPEDPVLPEVTVEVSRRSTTVDRLPLDEATTTVAMPDGTRHVLRGGFAAPLPSFPQPLVGCGLRSASTRWDCSALFSRNRFTPIPRTGSRFESDSIVLAQALGLARVAPAERRGADMQAVLASVEAARRRTVEAETAKLERALADVSADVGGLPFKSLRGQPDAIVERLDRIVAAIERGIEIRRKGRNNAQQLWRLLWLVPATALDPYRNRIDAFKDKDGWFVPKSSGS